MNCPNCGAEVRGSFCTICGTRVDRAPSDQPSQDPTRPGDPDATSYIRQEDLARLERVESAEEPGSSAGAVPQPASEPPPFSSSETPSPTGAPYTGSPLPPSGGPAGASSGSGWGSGSSRWGGGFGPSSHSVSTAAVMQPMSLGQIISGTRAILMSRMPQFLGVAAVVALAMFVAGIIFALIAGSAFSSIASGLSGTGVLEIVIGSLILFAVAIAAGSVAGAAYINIARGEETAQTGNLVADTQSIIQRAMADAPRLFLTLLLVWGGYFVISLVIGILAGSLGPLGGLLRLIWFIGGIWYEVTFLLAPQAAVIDGRSPVDAMMESKELVTGYWWRTFGYSLVGGIMLIPAYIVALIVIVILAAILSFIPFLGGIATALVGAAVFSLFYAFIITYLTLMFFDLKARKAGMAQEATAAPVY